MNLRLLGILGGAIASTALYYGISFLLPRSNFQFLMLGVILLFFLYQYLYEQLANAQWWKWGVLLGVVLRVLHVFSFPSLSDDVFRFFWDGNNSVQGISPFADLPSAELAANTNPLNDKNLFEQLNSQEYFSVYPPVCQSVFFLAAKMFPQNYRARVILMKLFLLFCEMGSIYLIIKLLALFSLPPGRVILYALNPLAIIEVVGNIHFEGAMVFFLLLTLYFIKREKYLPSIGAMVLAIGSKLLPLMLLPFIWKKVSFSKFIAFCALSIVLVVLSFLPFSSFQDLPNLFTSLNLYFEKFEFNASIYYFIRYIGFYTHGYNILFMVGKYLTIATTALILIYAWFKRSDRVDDLPENFMFALSIYLAFATIVHPWYVVPVLAFSVFTRFRYAAVWSAMVFLSYFAYSNPAYLESMKLVLLEYGVVLAWFIYEWKFRKSSLNLS